MEDAKLQVLHDTLSQIRGKNGLGTNTQFSWQRGTGATQTATRHPLALHLPDNALYAHFLPEGVYDPASNNIDYGDGRIIKRDFSDAIIDGDVANKSKKRKRKVDSEEKARRKEIRKAEKKAAKKVEKLKAKREAKLEEKKRQKKLEKKIKKEQSSEVASRTPAKQLDLSKNNNIAETAAKPSNSNNKNHMIEINKEIEQKEAKKRKKAKITMP